MIDALGLPPLAVLLLFLVIFTCVGWIGFGTGERWPARNENGKAFKSYEPHCESCESDARDGWHVPDNESACCCVHREEQR